MNLSLTTRQCEPDITAIEVGGRITLGQESDRIEAAVLKTLEEGIPKLVIDLSDVTYIDSSGIGIIAYCIGKISQKGAQGAVAGAKGKVMDVFRLTHLDTVIRFFPDVATACANLNADGAKAATEMF